MYFPAVAIVLFLGPEEVFRYECKTVGDAAVTRKQKRVALSISGLVLLAGLALIVPVLLSDSERQSMREFLEELKSKVTRGKVVVPQLNLKEIEMAEAEGDESGVWPSYDATASFKKELHQKIVRILRKDPEGYGREAVDALGDEELRRICDQPLWRALWEVGTIEDGSWRADNPIFKALLTRLESESADTLVRSSIAACIAGARVLPDAPYVRKEGYGDSCDRKTVEMLRTVVNPSRHSDYFLLMYIGANIYKAGWPDLAQWFNEVASEEVKSFAYGPTIERAILGRDRDRFVECLSHVRKNLDYGNMGILASAVKEFLPDTSSPADLEFCKSVIRPFLIEVMKLPPTSIWQENWRDLPEKQRQKELAIEAARTGAYTGLVTINDPEATHLIEEAVLDEGLPVRYARREAFAALGYLYRQPNEAIQTALRILAENADLHPDVRAKGYSSICQLWCFSSEDGMFFQRDAEFDNRIAQFTELLRKDIRRQPWQFVSKMVVLAEQYVQRFDKALACEIIDAALAFNNLDEPTRKHLERAKKKLGGQDDAK
jgi:hypothetical protein